MADSWKLIITFGIQDAPTVASVRSTAREVRLQFVEGTRRLGLGISETLDKLATFDLYPSEVGTDLLLLAASIYCADTRLHRGTHSQDNWTREIEIHLPVTDPFRWDSNKSLLETALNFLTGDLWRFSFRPRPAGFDKIIRAPRRRAATLDNVCLFSGGLDSFIGTIDLLRQGKDPLLVSHSWVANASKHQILCLKALRKRFGRALVRHLRARIGFPSNFINYGGKEDTERSRSFLFFSLAACAASASSTPKTIILPENGLITLNVPLDPLRIGALSTRTTHPFFVARYNELLQSLGICASLANPYRHKTKGEMVRDCLDQRFLVKNIAHTISCSSPNKGRWLGQSPGHCGYCVPCLIRRAALLTLGTSDPTPYGLSNLRSRPLNSQKAEGEQVRSFQLAIRKLNRSAARASVLIHQPGALADAAAEIDSFASVYLRGMKEVEDLLIGVTTRPHA